MAAVTIAGPPGPPGPPGPSGNIAAVSELVSSGHVVELHTNAINICMITHHRHIKNIYCGCNMNTITTSNCAEVGSVFHLFICFSDENIFDP